MEPFIDPITGLWVLFCKARSADPGVSKSCTWPSQAEVTVATLTAAQLGQILLPLLGSNHYNREQQYQAGVKAESMTPKAADLCSALSTAMT